VVFAQALRMSRQEDVMRVFLLSIVTLVCACSSYENPAADAGVDPKTDADIDAKVDEPPPPQPAPGRELAPAAGRLTGGTWAVDVHIGSVVSQSSISAGSWSVRGGTPIHP
jgi:hypothetical protein